MRLEEKVAIVTGSAQGIGRGVALHFAREGASVMVCDIQVDKGKETVELVRNAGGNASFIECDVSKARDVERMVDVTVKTFGKLNVLYNNAAVQLMEGDPPVDLLVEENWDRVMSVDLKGPYLCMKYAIPSMIHAGGGSITNISSITAAIARKQSAYTAAKGGLLSLSRLVAKNYASKKVRCNVICPGPIDSRGYDDETKRSFAKEIPIGRIGEIEDVSYCSVYLASDESSYVTGSVFFIDGGMTSCPTRRVEPTVFR